MLLQCGLTTPLLNPSAYRDQVIVLLLERDSTSQGDLIASLNRNLSNPVEIQPIRRIGLSVQGFHVKEYLLPLGDIIPEKIHRTRGIFIRARSAVRHNRTTYEEITHTFSLYTLINDEGVGGIMRLAGMDINLPYLDFDAKHVPDAIENESVRDRLVDRIGTQTLSIGYSRAHQGGSPERLSAEAALKRARIASFATEFQVADGSEQYTDPPELQVPATPSTVFDQPPTLQEEEAVPRHLRDFNFLAFSNHIAVLM